MSTWSKIVSNISSIYIYSKYPFRHCRNQELLAPWAGSRLQIPTKFIIGDLDLVYHMPGVKEYIHKGGFKRDVPLLEEVVIMEGVGHFINQEKGDEISKHIYDFFNKFWLVLCIFIHISAWVSFCFNKVAGMFLCRPVLVFDSLYTKLLVASTCNFRIVGTIK